MLTDVMRSLYRSLEPYILLAAIVALLLLVALGFAAARMLGTGR